MNELLNISKEHPILLFDGVCNLCNGFVQFAIKRDPGGKFRFASLQSQTGKQILRHFNLPTDEIFSVVLVENGKAYTQSTASLRFMKNMESWHRFLSIFLVVPSPIRNFIYKIIANNRYNWFGQSEQCMVPTPELQARFLL